MRRKAKIGATLGPACDDVATLRGVIDAGLDVARLNFSHGIAADHAKRVARLRRQAKSAGRHIAVLADLQGPRFRVGTFPEGGVTLAKGTTVDLVAGTRRARPGSIPVAYAALAQDAKRGCRVLIDDGNVELRVLRVKGDTLTCEVLRGGLVTDNKGINLPGTAVSAPALTAKDKQDLKQAVELGADWLAVSFVRKPADVRSAKRLLRRAGSDMPVMAKIEHPDAVENLEEILAEADGLLVARGDLGVELPPQDVPMLQKRIIEAANAVGKPVMTATQMLESMRRSQRPTRAEASDVANAVLDGSDCLLLAAETAAGKFPVQAVAMMAGIIEKAESSGRVPRPEHPQSGLSVPLSTCLAGCRAAWEIGARMLAVFSKTGFSARLVARFRPRTPIVVFAVDPAVARRMQMSWGVDSRVVRDYTTIEQMIRILDRELLKSKLAKRGEHVVMLAGTPVGVTGTTNLVQIHRVGDDAKSGR